MRKANFIPRLAVCAAALAVTAAPAATPPPESAAKAFIDRVGDKLLDYFSDDVVEAYPFGRSNKARDEEIAKGGGMQTTTKDWRLYNKHFLFDGEWFAVEWFYSSVYIKSGARQVESTLAFGKVRDGKIAVYNEVLRRSSWRVAARGEVAPVPGQRDAFPVAGWRHDQASLPPVRDVSGSMKLAPLCLFIGGWLTLSAPGLALTLSETKTNADDLALSGAFAGVPAGTVRYVSHAELLALPEVTHITEEPSPGMGQHDCTVLFMADFLKSVPLASGADCILLRCADKWESIYREVFIKRWNPYILLRMDGKNLDGIALPAPFDKEKLAPYYTNVSLSRHPGFRGTDYNNVDPTQVVELVATNYDDYLKPWFSGKYANLDAQASAGRSLFINNCAVVSPGAGRQCGWPCLHAPLGSSDRPRHLQSKILCGLCAQPAEVHP